MKKYLRRLVKQGQKDAGSFFSTFYARYTYMSHLRMIESGVFIEEEARPHLAQQVEQMQARIQVIGANPIVRDT